MASIPMHNETEYTLTDEMRSKLPRMPKSILGKRSARSGCSMASSAMPSTRGRMRCVTLFPSGLRLGQQHDDIAGHVLPSG